MTTQTDAARENARDKSNGRFGEQQLADPGTDLLNPADPIWTAPEAGAALDELFAGTTVNRADQIAGLQRVLAEARQMPELVAAARQLDDDEFYSDGVAQAGLRAAARVAHDKSERFTRAILAGTEAQQWALARAVLTQLGVETS